MTPGIDLTLTMIEEDYGTELARGVAEQLVVRQRRSGGQSQRSIFLALDAKSDRIQTALIYAKCNLHQPLGVRGSPRQRT